MEKAKKSHSNSPIHFFNNTQIETHRETQKLILFSDTAYEECIPANNSVVSEVDCVVSPQTRRTWSTDSISNTLLVCARTYCSKLVIKLPEKSVYIAALNYRPKELKLAFAGL